MNYGHTIGHGLEAATGYTSLLHGEAVSVGMVAAVGISANMGIIAEESVDRYIAVLERFGLPISSPGVNPASILEAIELDKKSNSRKINWVLLEDIGQSIVRSDVPSELVSQIVQDMCS